MNETQHISIYINCPADKAYQFISNPANLPLWASGLSGGIKLIENDWISESPMGKVIVRFVAKNNFGVLDHEVILESGISFQNPMRVISNGGGAEVTFTLFKTNEMNREKFEVDAAWVKKDLLKLKSILEGA